MRRIPNQKRAIEKRNRIIEMGFELMCDKGYFNTDCGDIAKYAGVSTGIIYQYFENKKEIFMEGAKNHATKIMYPMINILEAEKINLDNLNDVLSKIIDAFVENHKISKKAHEELLAMMHVDDDIASVLITNEIDFTSKISIIFEKNNIVINNKNEKIHIIIGLLENLCHELVYHKHKEMNYDIMKEEVINTINCILTRKW